MIGLGFAVVEETLVESLLPPPNYSAAATEDLLLSGWLLLLHHASNAAAVVLQSCSDFSPRIRHLLVCPRVFNLLTLTRPCGATFHWSLSGSIDVVRLDPIRCASYLAVAEYLGKVLSSSFAPTSTWRGLSRQCRIHCSSTYHVHAPAIKA